MVGLSAHDRRSSLNIPRLCEATAPANTFRHLTKKKCFTVCFTRQALAKEDKTKPIPERKRAHVGVTSFCLGRSISTELRCACAIAWQYSAMDVLPATSLCVGSQRLQTKPLKRQRAYFLNRSNTYYNAKMGN